MTLTIGTEPDQAVTAAVYVGTAQRPLADELAESIVRVVVDLSLRLPGMFEIVFDDRGLSDRLTAALAIGTEVGIAAASPLRIGDPRLLITGEVTALEAEYGEAASIVVRGYTHEHRLQRARRTRTFVNSSDADIAKKIALGNKLTIGEITPTRAVHEHVGQVNQTDWEFLVARAAAIGFETGVEHGRFFFRAWAGNGRPVSLMLLSNLLSFAPRVTAGNLAGEAEVRVWDPLTAKVVSERVEVTPGATAIGSRLTTAVTAVAPAPTGTPSGTAGDRWGPKPSERATVVPDRPVSIGTAIGASVRDRADALADRMADTFAEAVGESIGDPWLSVGRLVEVSGVAAPFAGRWLLTRVRHEVAYGRYRTGFEVSGQQDRSLLGLVAATPVPDRRIPGVVCGIVTNTNDPLAKGRVKVVLPWLSPDYETGWACVIQPGAGQTSGTVFLPEPDDEVLVGFEYGDLQRPYVLGGIVNNHSRYTLGAQPVQANGNSAAVHWRGVVAPSGNRLAFHDDVPAPGRVDQAEILLGSGDGNLTLQIDQVGGVVALRCLPGQATKPGEKGRLTIECGPGGAIEVKAGAGGSVTIDGGAELNLKAQKVKLDGALVSVNGTGPVQLKGKPIQLN
ncbi:VgrG-related protein [Kribbella monticola]|uniref:VgrG-related protein n=1 Tax=Kribbella monticola TaxID=2185285 RepID=UPI000DD4B086|nr:VgrG-related protein [Kribbella monticola]